MTTYVLVKDGVPDESVIVGDVPDALRGSRRSWWNEGGVLLPGLEQVVEVSPPALLATETWDSPPLSVEEVDGEWALVWNVRDKTDDELAAATTASNRATIEERLEGHIAENQDFMSQAVTDYENLVALIEFRDGQRADQQAIVDDTTKTNAERQQANRNVQELSREIGVLDITRRQLVFNARQARFGNGMVRFVLSQFDDVSDT